MTLTKISTRLCKNLEWLILMSFCANGTGTERSYKQVLR